MSFKHAQKILDNWKWECDTNRPYSLFGDLTSEEYTNPHHQEPENFN